MSLHNTTTRYGGLAKTFHWMTAVAVIALIPLGIIANGLPFDTSEELARKAFLFSLHKTLGVSLFFFAIARILWTLRQVKPAPLHPERKLETFAAETVHWLLYGSLILVPLTGWVHHAATTGFAPIWWPFGQNLPLVPDSTALADVTAGLHIVFERVLALAILMHVAGALKHHVLDKDDTLRRMLPGKTEAGQGAHRSPMAGLAAALGAWILALAIGGAMGVYGHETPHQESAELQEVSSDWQVQEGSLSITVQQFGQAVTGAFGDWTASISFDENAGTDQLGAVEVEIAIGSLTLGSVTGQAMGPDFFDVEQFPTARFTAPITRTETGYLAEGLLSLKGTELPVSLPFSLELEGEQATMSGKAELDRRAFAIGNGVTDEGQLAFGVTVDVALTATRQTQ